MVDPLPTVAYGAWPSPITAARLVEGAAGVSEIRADGEDVWWNEQRPSEGGRYQLVRRSSSGNRHDLFGAWDPDSADGAWNARTAVMEYGGGAWGVRNRVVVFANWADQRLYRVDPGGEPTAISPAPSVARGFRWSEPTWLDERWLVCVRESHEPDVVAAHGEAMNELVAIPVDASAVDDPALVHVLVSGPDFVQSPALRGDRLAWLQWDHPRMPWDGTELMLATIVRDETGQPVGVGDVHVVAGGAEESVIQPGFTAAGDLVFCTDRTGWWNPWRLPAADVSGGGIEPVIADGGVEAEIGGALWVGGLRWWAEAPDGALITSFTHDGADGLARIDAAGELVELATPFTEVGQVVAGTDGRVLVVAGTPVAEGAPYAVDVTQPTEGELDDTTALEVVDEETATVVLDRLRPARDLGIGTEWFSQPSSVSFPSADGRTAHALHYPPLNAEVEGPGDEQPPLVVMIHGGPTSAARSRLDLAKQFWTSRGFAVVDVNYGGSTGYGRPYRNLLQGAWGVVDVEDAVAAARYLADEELADTDRLAIRGGSAGGYTTLAALCFHDVFRAGASHFGVADLAALATETHKFESRYLDGLVGPWPEARAVYEERSPIFHTERIDCPLAVFQGLDDPIVPPNQAQMIVDSLRARGVPVTHVTFEGEQHGFRKAENIKAALDGELAFYLKVL